MKKIFLFLTALCVSMGTVAKQTNQEGRQWITASDVVVKPADKKTAAMFKTYVLQSNKLDKCLFPDIYRAKDQGEAILEKWWNDTENGGRLKRTHYLKLKMRLAQKIMGNELAQSFLENRLPAELSAQYQTILTKYGKTTTVKSHKACKKVGQYATDLVESYDEVQDKWRKDFPNP